MFASQLGSVTCSFFIIPSVLVIVLICLGLPPPVTSLNIGIFILLHSLVAAYSLFGSFTFLKWQLKPLLAHCLDFLLTTCLSSLP